MEGQIKCYLEAVLYITSYFREIVSCYARIEDMSADERCVYIADNAYSSVEDRIIINSIVKALPYSIKNTELWDKVYSIQNIDILRGEAEAIFELSQNAAQAHINEVVQYCDAIDRHSRYFNTSIRNLFAKRGKESNSSCVSYFTCIEGGALHSHTTLMDYKYFKSVFDRTCGYWGYGRPLNSSDTDVSVFNQTMREVHNKMEFKSVPVQPPMESQFTFEPIDDIIIYQDAQRAKDIIKNVMKDTKNKTACVAIRALIMAEIIKSEHTIARCTIFKIISEFLETDIGTDNSIGRHWKKSEDAAKEKCNQIKKSL